tara:strand:+ start:11446 stop:11931 length:486 start_codon:yes stop_codon:yes gene_type:complete
LQERKKVSQRGIRSALFLVVLALPLAQAAAAQVALEGAWVRALPPTQTRTAAYLTVRNASAEAVVISGASTPIAGRVELHETLQSEGMMRMQEQSEVRVPAGAEVSFVPGGLHLMLLDLDAMPAVGDVVELCLTIDGAPLCTPAETRRDAAPAGHHDHQHH